MKVCPSCKREAGYGNDYCTYCGAKLDEPADTENGVSGGSEGRSDSEIRPIHILIVIGIFIIIGFAVVKIGAGLANFIREQKCINIVKSGSLEMYSDMKLGPAFNDYFANPKWEYGYTVSNDEMVEFKGKCNYYDEPTELTIQFFVDFNDETFTLEYVGVGREGFSIFEIYGLFEDIYDNYTGA